LEEQLTLSLFLRLRASVRNEIPPWDTNQGKEGYMANEEYVYYMGKITFIVTPVYKENGETMGEILLKLMLTDIDAPKFDAPKGRQYNNRG